MPAGSVAPSSVEGGGGGGEGLSPLEEMCLPRIWASNRRRLVDVRPTSELLLMQNQDKKRRKKGGSGDGGDDGAGVPEHAYRFVVRLHKFFVDVLSQPLRSAEDAESAAAAAVAVATEEAASAAGEPSLSHSNNRYLKHPSQSCLQELMMVALTSPAKASNGASKGTSDDPIGGGGGGRPGGRPRVRLMAPGRGPCVVHVPHGDFLSELDDYELRGQPKTSDYVQRHSFGAYLYHVPTQALAAAACAIRLAILTLYLRQQQEQQQQQQQQQQQPTRPSDLTLSPESTSVLDNPLVNAFLDRTQLVVRFVRVQPVVQMMDIKTSVVNKLLSVRGHVVKARPKQLRVATADFSCTSCGAIVIHEFDEGRYSSPSQCSRNPDCRSTTFALLRPTARYQDVQLIRIQEAQDESFSHAGRTPRQLVLELESDLVDACRPGDTVLVAAVVSAVNTSLQQGRYGKKAQETSTYTLYLRGHSVTTTSETADRSGRGPRQRQRRPGSWQQQRQQSAAYSSQQLQAITRLCHADHKYFGMVERRAFPFDLLVRSLCPSIIGHHPVKAGLLLCLLGGTPPLSSSGTNSSSSSTAPTSDQSMRSNSHVLVVGDPGMGKSQMLLAASQLASRSVYVGGNTSSTTGLTVTLTKEASGESGMEVGALVLSDLGICCIDEFDKMHKSHQDGLLEAMEQQQVSIAKAGVVASLPARCSVIAAANPKNGSYNMSKTVAENLNMAKPILSRFDLVFILRDRTDKEQDGLVSSNIINLYRRNQNPSATCGSAAGVATTSFAAPVATAPPHPTQPAMPGATTDLENQRMPLKQRLSWVHDFQKEPLPASLVRDYIAYAREYCRPKLTPEAAVVLKEYFMELRYPPSGGGRRKQETVPITTRQLEALIRLCQARAKACLREYCLREDALDVVELMGMSVEQVHSDETGYVDRSRGGAGGRSQRQLKKAFVEELHLLVGRDGAECGLDDLRRIADRVSCGLAEFPGLVEDLRLQGVVIKKSNGRFQVVS